MLKGMFCARVYPAQGRYLARASAQDAPPLERPLNSNAPTSSSVDAAYDECVKNAFRDAHLLESPGSMWKLSHSHFAPEHVDVPNTVSGQSQASLKTCDTEQYGLYLPKLCQPDLGLGQLEGRGWDPDTMTLEGRGWDDYDYLVGKWDMDACGFNDNMSAMHAYAPYLHLWLPMSMWGVRSWASEPGESENHDKFDSIVEMAKDKAKTREVQRWLKGDFESNPSMSDGGSFILMEVTQNLTELMFDPHAIFVIRECFCLVTRYGADDKPEFSNAVCETILEQWESLVLGRKSTFSYKMAMWVIIADRRVGRFESSLRTFLVTLETKMFFFSSWMILSLQGNQTTK